tara:strand:- start:12 stop:743 length:732 start_codon:yes stop_codon:yes gene_type:complete
MGREKIEAERAAKLVELRKKYLARKGIISKAGTPNKVKLVGRDKVEAERRKKLEELREKYLAKKREVTKSIRPTARKTDTEKYVAKGSRTGTAKPKSATGRSTVLGTEVYSAKGKRTGTAKPTPYVAKGKRTGTAKPKYIAKGKRTGTAKPKYVAKGKRTGTAKQLAPIKSVRPIANTKNQMGYYEDKKKGNVMVRVYPNITPTRFGDMTAKQIEALNLPSRNSRKYTVDFNQRDALTFIIKK